MNNKKIQAYRMNLLIGTYRMYFKWLFAVRPQRGARKAFKLFSTPLNKKTRVQEMEVLAQARAYPLPIGGRQVQVYEWGSGEKAALLVHGWESHAGSMGAFVAPLLAKGYRVLAFDGPAHGRSEGRQTNPFDFARVISHLLRTNSGVEVVVTHSFGSSATIFAIHQHPELAPKKLVMVTSADKFEDVVGSFAKVLRFSPKGKQYFFDHMAQRFGKHPEDVAISDMAPQTGVEKVLLLHDKGDKILPVGWSENIAKKWPQAQLITFEGLGHYKILWSQQVLTAFGEFLEDREIAIPLS